MINDTSIKKVVLTLGVLLSLFVATLTIAQFKSMSYIGDREGAQNTISVSGKGEIVTTPDIATFDFSVTEEAQTVADAQKSATDKMNALLAYVEKAGVDDKDVKTTSYSIYPRYEYRNATIYTSGTQYLAAYVVSQTIELKVRDLSKAGDLLSGVGSYGATNISGLTFSMDKQDDLVREARGEAITDARAQAEVLAKALGVSLGRIVSFSESTPYQPYPVYYAVKDSMTSAGAASAPAPEIPTGENKITSNVSITYEIK